MYRKVVNKLERIFLQLLLIERIRFYYCRLRFRLMKKNIRVLGRDNEDIGEKTIKHNLDGLLQEQAAFGMGGRMGLLLTPTAMLLREHTSPRTLIVGPRTEDDIIWAHALGLRDTRGLDLISYSPLVDIGDIHHCEYADEAFDAVLLGWMISYSANPSQVFEECRRILAPGGFLGIGIESNIEMKRGEPLPAGSPRVNTLNTADDLITATEMAPVFVHNPGLDRSYDCAVIVKKRTASVE